MQTEGLLKQSQQLAAELQTQQTELQQTNEQLAQKAQQLAEQNAEVERKNQEIEQARRALEEKATELALTSKYKSEFLANMSHELRTPLNSILILGQQLGENPEGNLSPQAGRVRAHHPRRRHRPAEPDQRHPRPVEDRVGHGHGRRRGGRASRNLLDVVARPFRHEAENRAARRSTCSVDPHLGRSIVTDSKRLQQVLKNLLSNAFKFTEQGGVRLDVSPARGGWSADHPVLNAAPAPWSRSRSPTPASASRPRSRRSSSRRSSRPMPAPAASTAAPASASPSAASSRACSAARSSCAARPASGSTFTLYLPLTLRRPVRRRRWPAPTAGRRRVGRASRRCASATGRSSRSPTTATTSSRATPSLLIVEDDPHYARVLRRPGARRRASRCWSRCAAPRRWRWRASTSPTAVSLDVFLPDMLGWTVLSQLKQDPAHAPHPGADRHARRGPPARPGARRVRVRHQADHDRGPRGGARAHQGLRRRRAASACWSSRTTPPSS